MKRILSLFLSLVLVLSMCLGNVINVSASTLDETTMIEKTNTLVDLVDKDYSVNYTDGVTPSTYSTVKSPLDGTLKRGITFNITKNKNTVTSDTTTFNTSTIKCDYHTTVGYTQIQCDWSINNSAFSPKSVSGDVKVRFSGRMYNTAEGIPSFEIKNYASVALSNNEKLKANTWYTFDSLLDLTKSVSDFTVTFTEELSAASSAEGAIAQSISKTATTGLSGFSYIRFRSGATAGTVTYFDDLKLEYTEPPFEKAEIKNVGTNNVVTDGQNIVPITLSADIPEITKDHIAVTNLETNQEIDATSIEVTSDGTNPVVKASLSSNLASWSQYRVTISADAFGAGTVQRTGDDEATAVTDISKEFETSKPPFATKGFSFESVGGEIVAKGLVANTTGTPKDIKMVFSSFNSNGTQGAIVPTNCDDFNNASGEEIEASTAIDGLEKYNFFIIDNWTNKTPLLGVSANVDESGNIIDENPVSGGALSGTEAAISADELNHDTLELSVRVDTKANRVADGILFVYAKGETLSDTNLPLYAKSVSTAADGTLSTVIPLTESLDYGEYTVEFACAALPNNLTDNFNRYTAEELLQARKDEILADAKNAATGAELKEILLGLNADDETVNSNFDIFGADTDMTDYETVLDRDNIFTRMLSSVAGLADYDALVALFESASADQVQYEIENPTIMIEGIKATVADTTHTTTYASTTANYSGTQALMTDSVKNHWMFTPANASKQKCYEISNDTSFGGSVAKFEALTPTYFQMFFGGNIPGGADITYNTLKGRTGIMEGRIRFTHAVTPKFKFSPEGGNSGELSIGGTLNADTWYKFKWEVVPGSFIKVTFTEIGVDNPHEVSKKWNYTSESFTYFRFFPSVPTGESLYLDDVVITTDLVPYEKAKITSVGTANVVEGYQNILSFELSNKIPTLTKDHITVTNKETNDVINADSITVTGDSTQTVSVTLSDNLSGWSEYTLTIDPLAFGEGNFQRTGRQELAEITALNADFATTKAPLAAKPFVFTYSNSLLNAKTLVANTTGSAKDMQFVFASFDKDGRLAEVASADHSGFSSGEEAYLDADISTSGAQKFNFFVIDTWADKNMLFGANYTVDGKGAPVEVETIGCDALEASVAAMELGEFDYENIKLEVSIDTKSNTVTEGIIFVYKTGEALSSTNLPTYAKAVKTTADGTLKTEVLLPKDAEYSAYTVEFVSDKLTDGLTKTFNYYSPEEILANKRAAIFADAKASSSAEELQEVITGVNSAGELLNDNFDVFTKDTDMTDYIKNIDKLAVFEAMLPSVSNLADYDALVNLFETCAQNQRSKEVEEQKIVIANEAKASQTYGALRMVMLGINEKGEAANTNFEVVSTDANMTNYNKLKSKDKVFIKMYDKLSQVSDYDSLIELFEKCAKEQYNSENESKPSASSNNKGYGGSSVAVKETVDKPVVSAPETGSAAVSTGKFADMKSHWAENYVNELADRGIMNGYTDGSFRGENGITRAELAKTLVEALEVTGSGSISYSDVSSDSWYATYVARAALAGIVKGYEDGTFAPDVQVTRQDAALMLYRAMSIGRQLPLGYTFFTDDLDIDDYASGAIRTLGDLGIVNGDSNKAFKPKNTITRAEVATIICRALDYIESH